MYSYRHLLSSSFRLTGTLIIAVALSCGSALARDVDYESGEIDVRVTPGEPTQLQFPGTVAGGFKKKLSTLSIDKKGGDLIIFANEGVTDAGEAIIVRLDDGRSYSVRVRRSGPAAARDDIVRINDDRAAMIAATSEEEEPSRERQFQYAPPSQVSGLMREMVLMAEFGKKAIPGYRVSDRYRGDTVLNDGTVVAKIDKILVGPNLWGYVIEVENQLDQMQLVNPATFRLDGTRAISASRWELAPRPMNVEEQIAGKEKTKLYIVTRAKR